MSQVNVIDSILITEERDTSKILAEWSALDPSITVYSNLQAAQAVKLFLYWSDKNGTIPLQQGDDFTFVVPDVFNRDRVKDITDAAIKTPSGEVLATYSIYDNDEHKKEVKITFTDYVETHTHISGNLWLLLFVGKVDSTEEKTIEFEINGGVIASGEVTITPEPPYTRHPDEEKYGKSVLVDIYNGYYIFNWTVRFNMDEDTVNGFHTFKDFSFEDVIPENSPHVFLTEEIRQELGFSQDKFPLRIGEYMGADSYPPENRYPLFSYQYNSTGANLWTNFNHYDYLVNGYTTVGIDGTDGLNVSDVVLTGKLLSAKLGTLTRPTTLQYCTMATVKIAESALGDSEVVKLFINTFKSSHIEDLTKFLDKYIFGSGGEGQGITGPYSFTLTKVDEKGTGLPGAMFSLYTSKHFEAGIADRFVYSDGNGVVTFISLPAGTYYLRETGTPNGYIPNNTVYKVEIRSDGFEIYYGDNFENKLSDHDNKIVNRSEVLPCSVTLEGIKNLTGKTLESDMFNFVIKDSGGDIIATGSNEAGGSINFSEIEFHSTGEYTFTVEEVRGTYSGITYDSSQYMVTVTITDDGSGKLKADVAYPSGGVIFNNRYTAESISVTLAGTKDLTGKTLESGMFSFIVKDSGGKTVATGTNEAGGSINFSEIEFDSPGIYTFMVEEVRGTYSGMTYDSSQYTVTVTVTDDGAGKLNAEISYPGGGVVFNNRYATLLPISVSLKATKKLTGKTLSSGMFSFILKDTKGLIVATGINDENGSINFSEIKFDSTGVYTFTVAEIGSGYKGMIYDGSIFTVTVTVTDDGSGNLSAEIAYPDEGVVFNNRYSETPVKPCQCFARSTKCRKTIEGEKIWVDNDNASNKRPTSVKIILLRDGEVYKSINVDSTGDGSFIFCCVPIGKKPGHKYDYQIDEANVPNGYTKTIDGYNVINTLIT